MGHFIVCYDIANPKRLGRVHRRAVSHARFVQYSVYYREGTQNDLQAMLDDIEKEINPKEDDVRAYAVAPLEEAICLGQPWMPDDIRLL
jgi:CRISPR-associated protein Cas2